MATNILIRGQVTVPNDYCSVHTKWPGAGVDPTTLGLSIGNVRLLDGSSGWMWRHIETLAGVYSWAALDARITFYRQQGWTVTFPLYGTPTFYASVPDQGFNDMYNSAGGAAYPSLDTGLAGLSAFITALITRYNDAGGAWRLANPTLGKGIDTFECWNEPQFAQNRSGYWWGSAAQLVDVCHTAYSAVKAVDPAVVVTSPAFFNDIYCWPWIQAKGAVNTSVSATQTFDALNVHSYLGMPYGAPYGGWPFDIAWSQYGVYPFINFARRYKADCPVYVSEYGFDTGVGTSSLASLLLEAPEVRRVMLARVMLTAAAMGAKRFGCYSLDNVMTGNFQTDTMGVVSAFNTVAQIAGKTIIEATAEMRGAVTLRFSDGSTLSV